MQDATTWRSSAHDAETAPDEPLVRAAQRDPDSFWLLYERHRPAVYRYLRARTAQEEDAADLTATTFERAFAGIRSYRPQEALQFRAWLFRIARNAAVDAARRRRPAATLDAIGELRGTASDAADPEHALLDGERIREVRRLVGSLPEPQREAIVLRYAGELSGMSSPNDPSSAANLLWFRTERPLATGSRTFHLTLPTIGVRDLSTPPPSEDPTWYPWHQVAGPWTFEFTIPVKGASVADPKVTAEAAGVTLRLRDVAATDASILAGIEVVSTTAKGGSWFPVGAFEHDGQTFAISRSMSVKDGPLSIEALESTSERSGE